MPDDQESRHDRVRRVALKAARSDTGNQKLTLADTVDAGTAMAIGSALAEEFDVEILGDASQEMGDAPIEAWVEFMDILLDG